MNNKLVQDIEIAYAKLKKINEANIKIMELNNRKNEINKKYEVDKSVFTYILASIWVSFLINLFIFIGYCIIASIFKIHYSVNRFIAKAILVLFIISIVKIFLGVKNNKVKTENWWNNEALPELQQIDDSINKLNQFISSTIKNDYVLKQLRPGMRNEEAVAGIYNIVKSNYADDLSSAASIWVDQELYRLEKENAAREKEKQLAALNSRLDEINRKLDEREFIEDMILMDMAYRK